MRLLTSFLRVLSARFFHLQRSFFGRFTRRRKNQSVQLGGRAPGGQWWSDDPRWFPGGAPPREHNAIAPLIDGEAAFAALAAAIRGARHYVYVAGWALTPAFALRRALAGASDENLLLQALAEASERVPVKVLVWSGATMLFQPTRSDAEQARQELLAAAPRLDCRLDDHFRPTHCHHQKAVVVDGQVGFAGGLDLTTLAGDRWDRAGHPLRFGRNWHDVMLQVHGEAVADIERNFTQRWAEVTGETALPHQPPRIEPGWHTPCQVVRTIPRGDYRFAPDGEFGIAHAYLAAIARARRFIYLENQYLWSPEIVDALGAALRRNDDDFRILIVLPARADMGKYDNDKHVELLQKADDGRGRFSAYALYTGGAATGAHGFFYRPVYVHAKVGIIDDEWYTVGSANLNGRGLATDSELNVQAFDPAGARALRLALWAEHLGLAQDDLAALDPAEVMRQLWPRRAAAVRQRVKRRRGFLPALAYPYPTDRQPGIWLLQEAQALLEEL
jgi:phosphatidylserine/phosphatidylglycerophosphate/cardiolipin synthase-like enzyme